MTTASPSTSSSWATTGTSCSPEPTGPGWKKTTMTDLTATPDLTPTPGQTVGPFYGYALPYDHDSELVPAGSARARSEEHTSEFQSRGQLVCRLLLQKKKDRDMIYYVDYLIKKLN